MNQSAVLTLTNLDSATIPLTGRHLIEASAGTGKTYNITRIYLRLLLERELKVEEILLMTFTKDATQELRGRIDAFIREALNNWQALCIEDNYFKAISERVSHDKAEFLLKRALLFLDEAAIFTIHGFCQRALTQHAFASGLPFNANMSTNSHELVLEATQDWYRQLAKQDSENFALVAQFWSTPSAFVSSFTKPISHRSQLSTIDVQHVVTQFTQLAQEAYTILTHNTTLLEEGLVTHKKADEQLKRSQELIKLATWLSTMSKCQCEADLLSAIKQPMPVYLLNGNRHPKAFKTQLAEILSVTKEVKTRVEKLETKINKAKAYKIVKTAIYQIREQVTQTKKQLNTLDFDDLINTLADCLKNESNRGLANTLLAQYPVALVDEFQDTDPQQFSILQGIYYQKNQLQSHYNEELSQCAVTGTALYLIGDPKQAIYGFRGGDIFAYLNARSDCDFHWLMDTNWRSSPAMVEAYNKVFLYGRKEHQSVFGYGIPYQAVLAGKKEVDLLNSSNKDIRALQFIHFTGDMSESKNGDDKISQSVRPLMATWCANEIVNLLNAGEVKPQDIAILVRDGREASDIKNALLQANLASVFLSDRANLFYSDEATQLILLLQGILAPEDERIYLKALTCGLLGYDAQALYKLQQNELAYQTLKISFFDYREQWQRQGFITMAINLMHQHFNFSRANMRDKKARSLTNLLHLFEILQSASQQFLQPHELLYWFEQQCNEQSSGAASELEAEQRLESDGDLIRIVTQHGAKGLEYPVVFIPFATRHKDPLKFGNKSVSYFEYHNEHGQLCLSLDGDDEAKMAMANESYAESIRLLYVAITRAEHRCYILTTAFDKYALSPLGKTLQWQPSHNIADSLQQLVEGSPDSISLQHVLFDEIYPEEGLPCQNDSAVHSLSSSKFIGKIERDWWLSSFSALSRNLRHGGVSRPDRDSEELFGSDLDKYNKNKKSLRFQLAKGAHSGNLLHDILENCHFINSNDAESNLLESIKWPLLRYGELVKGFNETDLISWLDEIIDAPLYNLHDNSVNFSLSDIPMQQTLRETEFYFPMENANVSALEVLLTDHRNTNRANEQLTNQNNITAVRLPSYKTLKGMMHGFIDLVFEQNGKYYVCDYKSSHLGDDLDDYNQQALRHNIEESYYDLQYLIYSLALHRHLKQSLIGYDAEQHFGGVYYLYLRGMSNDEQYHGTGVYFQPINSTELNQLDAIFYGKEPSNTSDKNLADKTDKDQA